MQACSTLAVQMHMLRFGVRSPDAGRRCALTSADTAGSRAGNLSALMAGRRGRPLSPSMDAWGCGASCRRCGSRPTTRKPRWTSRATRRSALSVSRTMWIPFQPLMIARAPHLGGGRARLKTPGTRSAEGVTQSFRTTSQISGARFAVRPAPSSSFEDGFA